MGSYDLVVHGGKVVTASDVFAADVAIRGEQIVALGRGLTGRQNIDATGKLVLPGAIDAHTHLDMPEGPGLFSADDFWTGSIAAACGGTTTVVDFAIQDKGQDLSEALGIWMQKAEGRAAVDYGFHMLICDFREEILGQMAEICSLGIHSFKLLFAYKDIAMMEDAQFFRLARRARELESLVMIHCENGDVIDTLVREAVEAGRTAPIEHARTRPAGTEAEATARAIHLASLAGAPVYIVHISCADALDEVRAGRRRGSTILAETCPQYLLLTEDFLDTPDFSGAKFVCSPPLRTSDDQNALWQALAAGELEVVATDHCPWNYVGQKDLGSESFVDIPNGLPGLETRLPLLFSEGYRRGRLTLNQFVAVCSTNPARAFGLYPRKGTIAPGSDADLVIFDPDARVSLRSELLHQNVDYTPYEGLELLGYPVGTVRRGQVIVRDGQFVGEKGSGQFLRRDPFSWS